MEKEREFKPGITAVSYNFIIKIVEEYGYARAIQYWDADMVNQAIELVGKKKKPLLIPMRRN